MGLILLGPFSFAQDSASSADSAQIEEVHDTKKLDKVLQEYNKDSEKVMKDTEVINQMQATGELSEEELDKGKLGDADYDKAREQAQNVLGDAFAKARGAKKQDLGKIKYSEAIRVTLAPLQKLSESELLAMLKENTKGSSAAVYVEQFPHLMVFAVKLIKDTDAIPSMVKIVDDQDKLIRFGGLMIATILFGFFLKRLTAKEGRDVIPALGIWFMRFLIMLSLRIGLIILFYGNELTPAFNVAKSTLFSL